MAKKTSFRDLLVKISNVFSTDAYLINNQYIISGPKSDDKLSGYFLLKLSPDMIELCKELFDSSKSYYISNIKNAKDNLSENYNEIKTEKIIDKFNKVNDFIKRTNEWTKLNLDDDTFNKFFEDNISIDLFKNDNKIPNVTVSKKLFPLITRSTFDNLYYSIFNDEDEYVSILFSFDFPFFQIYSLYHYIRL